MNSTTQQLTLRVSLAEMEGFCRTITHNSSNTARKHAALIALEGFISRHAGPETHSELHRQLLATIGNFSEQTRSKLLDEYAAELLPALTERNCRDIARLHRQVSRNGFHNLLNKAEDRLTADQYRQLVDWIEAWCSDAEQRGREASGYPDAVNLTGAGIDIAEYQAMNDVRKLLVKR